MRHEYIIGNIYGCRKLLKIYHNDNKDGRLYAKDECIYCGEEKEHRASELFDDRFTSCKCRTIKHGMNRTKLYSVYANIKYRCFNPNHHEFHNYGGKGISVCDEWMGENGFNNFMNWSYDNGYKEGLTIDRVDENGNYEPSNCQWITRSENTIKANKTSQHRKANNGTYYGIDPNDKYYEFENASQFAKDYNLSAECIRNVANGRSKEHKGWKFGFIKDLNKEEV